MLLRYSSTVHYNEVPIATTCTSTTNYTPVHVFLESNSPGYDSESYPELLVYIDTVKALHYTVLLYTRGVYYYIMQYDCSQRTVY